MVNYSSLSLKEMFTIALERLRRDPAGQVVADEYEADPATYAKPLQKKLDEAVKAEAEFKAQMETLLKQFDTAAAKQATVTGSTYTTILKGSGTSAQGEGVTAVGERGVNVGGNVGGPIITGSGTIINTGRAAGTTVSFPPALAPLRDRLVRYFNRRELKSLCFDLGVAYDDLPGDTRTELAEALVQHYYQRDRLPDLIRQCQKERPQVDWR